MKISSKIYTHDELKKRIGNIAQLGGTFHYELTEGRAKGTKAIDCNTGGGFHFTIIPDRGLDISRAYYRGINLVYLTPNGEVHPSYYDSSRFEWLRSFFAGLLTTCGLTYLGQPGRDGDEDLGLHGRYSNTPAKRVCDLSRWEKDNYKIEVTGIIEECSLFGPKLRLERKICSIMGGKYLTIYDRIENFGYNDSPFTILYHINPGFPLLNDNTYLVVSAKSAEPYDEHSERNMENLKSFSGPQPGFREQNFLHSMVGDKDNYGYAAVINPDLAGGLGLYIKYKIDALPYLSEWKMLAEGDYVVGIEPCNTQCLNRAALREKNMLPFLKPGEIYETCLEIGVLDGNEEIKAFEQNVVSLIKA